MTEQRKLEQDKWEPYFNMMTKVVKGKEVEIEVLRADLGAQTDITRRRLLGLSYDPRDNVLEVECEQIDHLIEDPREVFIDVDGADLKSFLVVQGDETKQVVKLVHGNELGQ